MKAEIQKPLIMPELREVEVLNEPKVEPKKVETPVRGTTEIVKRPQVPVLPDEAEWNRMKEFCNIAAKSGFIIQKEYVQAVTIAMKGRELGIPPMQAFAQIAVINGRPTCAAELMLALIYKNFPNAIVNILEETDKICKISAKRPNESALYTTSFTWEEAVTAGLSTRDNWKKYPKDMLRARAISRMARAKFPDAISGMSHTPEELDPDTEVHFE